MRELWAADGQWRHRFYCPVIVNDDGSAVENAKVASPTISFFQQPDFGYGEKRVYHATVTDNHIFQNRQPGQPLYNTYYFNKSEYTGSGYVRYRVHTYLNTVIEEYWKGEEYDQSPSQARWFLVYKYTAPRLSGGIHVDFNHVEWWCSESYAQEYGWTNGETYGYNFDEYSTAYGAYRCWEGKDLFHRYALTEEQAKQVLDTVSSSHHVPAGLTSELYRNAMNSITCNTNSIANVAEIIGILKDIKSGNIGALASNIPKYLKSKNFKKLASSSWLGYRYAYNTTKSDIEEYKAKLVPLLRRQRGSHIVRSGMAVPEGIAHCKVIYTDRALNGAQEVYTMLKRTGLALDAYTAWDMIPLSFVADWFLPIGNYLEDFSQNWVADTAIFDIATITTSWKWQQTYYDASGCYDVTSYTRYVTSEPPAFESYAEDPSTKTILKRVVDAAALIVG